WLPSVSFWLGLSCIGASVGSFDEATRFPGWAVLLPTTGAALMLLAGTARTGVLRIPRALLENSLSLWLGRVSYSMYLVHWPLIVLYRYYHGLELHIADQFALAASILVATCALHYGIERRFYRRSKNSDKDVTAISNNRFALCTVCVSVFPAVITANACRMSQTATAPVPPSN
ncbi:MAG: acyltransferase, partial [Proteobacteria bacterium]|nr:acyltransferase [Pseudomonadota bacterium]